MTFGGRFRYFSTQTETSCAFRLEGLPILRRQIEFEVFIWVRFDFGKDALGIANPVIALVVPKSNGRFDTCMHPFARTRNIRSEFSRRDRTDTSSEIRSAQIVGAGPLICSGSEHDIINWLIRTIIDRDLHQRHILCFLDIAFCIMHHPRRYLIRLREFSNLLIMIFRVVIRRKSNNDRSSRNNNCKKVGNVIKPWMLSTQESFQENPHILDRFLNLLPNTAYTHIPQNTRRIETSIKIRKHP